MIKHDFLNSSSLPFIEITMMKETIQQIQEILIRYTKIDFAFLFGSFLKHPLHDSDVDILLGTSGEASEQLDLAMELELVLKRKV